MGLSYNAHLCAARGEDHARRMMEEIGSGEGGVAAMVPKARYLQIKLKNVPVSRAMALKKVMVQVGADAAVSSGAYSGKAEATDVLLMGLADHINSAARLLGEGGEADLALASSLTELSARSERRRFIVPTPAGDLVLGDGPVLMGIINCTPDSFYDGGRHFAAEDAIGQGKKFLAGGVSILDVGGESTRPGSDPVSEEEELSRVLPVIEGLAAPGVMISIDTQKAGVARKAVEAGAAMINDVSALADPEMARVAADAGAALCLMHMLGTPRTMQKDPRYEDLFSEVIGYLSERMDRALAAGVAEDKIIVDPGIGFGKTLGHNLELIRDVWRLRTLGRPIMLAHSNKSFIGKTLGADIGERFAGTAAVTAAGVLGGAHIFRLHDPLGVKPYADMAWAVAYGHKDN